MLNRSGSAEWHGGLKDGKGTVSTRSGALKALPYSFNKRFGDEPGTNPEELIGAAHAACFSMALSNELASAGMNGIAIQTTSTITLEQDGDGFAVTRAHLVTRIAAGGDRALIEELAGKAKAGCPISKLLNAEVTMDATVETTAA